MRTAKAGLIRKKITVKGRKGTYQRSYMVKSDQPKIHTARSYLKKHGVGMLGSAFAVGVGSRLGHHAGQHLGQKHGFRRAGGVLGGYAGFEASAHAVRATKTFRKARDGMVGSWGSNNQKMLVDTAVLAAGYAGWKTGGLLARMHGG